MGGEDFGYYQTLIPGVFIRVGVRKNEEIIPVHNSRFDIDEESIPFSVGMMSHVIMKYFHEMEYQKKRII